MAGKEHASVTVIFNGTEQTIEYEPHEQVTALLERSMNAFKVAANRHLQSLFTSAGVELDDHTSVQDAGVKPGDTLILRPSTVKGGR